jgi:hypothetical protein
MKKLFLLAIATAFYSNTFAQIYWAKTCEISFFSPTSMENIDAVNKTTKPLLNIITGDLQIKIVMSGFDFPKPLMKEHFNENYAESEKFPNAFFKGKINEKVDWTKDGEYKVSATGKLTIHGVEKDRTIEGTATVKGQEITLSSSFKITFADHDIKIPFLYSGIIPEFTDVKINAVLEPYKKK